MSFQKNVIMVAIILLIVSLIFIGAMLYNSEYNARFPPVTGTCPDYWVDVGADPNGNKKGMTHCIAPGHALKDGKTITPPIYGYGLDTPECKSKWVLPNDPLDKSTTCEYKTWADKCKVSWDGVTNTNICNSSD